MRLRWVFAICLTACAAQRAPVAPAAPPKPVALPTADELFGRMAAAYAGATSYADRGEVVDVFHTQRGDHTRRLTFETAFIRPDAFRFEYRENGDAARAYIVWSRGDRTRAKWFVRGNKVTDVAGLGLALAGATGVSSGTAYIVPSMLLPDVVGGRSITRVRDPRTERIEWLEGQPCYKVSGVEDHGSRVFYIDVHSYLLHKVVERRHIDDFEVESTIRYQPILNGTVADSQLAEPVEATPSSPTPPSAPSPPSQQTPPSPPSQQTPPSP